MRAVGRQRPEDEDMRDRLRNEGQDPQEIERREQAKIRDAAEGTDEELRLLEQVADVRVIQRGDVHAQPLLHLAVLEHEPCRALDDVLVRGPV